MFNTVFFVFFRNDSVSCVVAVIINIDEAKSHFMLLYVADGAFLCYFFIVYSQNRNCVVEKQTNRRLNVEIKL